MAGSYAHCVDEEGRLLPPYELQNMLDTGGDVYEAIEQLYGMIWYLASNYADTEAKEVGLPWVEAAADHYKDGLRVAKDTLE